MVDALGAHAELSLLKSRIEAAREETRRLGSENRRLRGELRRASGEERIVERLHHGLFADAPVASLASSSTDGVKPQATEEQHISAEVAALQDEIEKARSLLASLTKEDGSGLEALMGDLGNSQETSSSAALAEQVLFADEQDEATASAAEAALLAQKKALQRRARALRLELRLDPPAAAVGGQAEAQRPAGTQGLMQRQRRRLQQMDLLASKLHEELKKRTDCFRTPTCPPTPASSVNTQPTRGTRRQGAGSPPAPGAAPSSGASAGAWSTQTGLRARLDPRGLRLNGQIKAMSQRFLLLRDLR